MEPVPRMLSASGRPMRQLARSGVLFIAALLSLCPVPATMAQGDVSTTFPDTELLAPDWVTPGTRLTFYVAGASIANASKQWELDPNGQWEDPTTGERYSQIDTPTAAGEGIFQVDVVGVDGPRVGLQWILYGLDRYNGRFYGAHMGGATDPGAGAEDVWVHPDILAQLPETDLSGFRILRGDYVLDGQAHQAVAILNPDPEAYSSRIYDIETGILLSGTTRTQGRASAIHAEGDDPLDPNSQITLNRLLGVRQLGAVGPGTTAPSWALAYPKLTYSGTWTIVNPFDPAAGPQTYPAAMSVDLGPGGSTWLEYRQQVLMDIGGLPNLTETSGVAGGGGPWWLDPAALAGAVAGILVDEDPITGERLVVESVDEGPTGGTVTLASELPGLSARVTYDLATGVLLAASRSEEASGITTDLSLDALP